MQKNASNVAQKILNKVILSPPVAKRVPHVSLFGVVDSQIRGNNPMNPPKEVLDHFYWMRDDTRQDEEVINYVKEENSYYEQEMAPLSSGEEVLYQHMLSNLKETDEEVPYQFGSNFFHLSRTIKGLPYKVHCRHSLTDRANETVILDENEIAKGFEYSDVGSWVVSPCDTFVAYSVDHNGYETYKVVVRNIATKTDLSDVVEDVSDSIVWGSVKEENGVMQSDTIYYLKMDSNHRPCSVMCHRLGTPQSEDKCLFTEDDENFWVSIERSLSGEFLFVSTCSKETSEYHYLRFSDTSSKLMCLRQREFGIRYEIDHQGCFFYIISNQDGAKNNKLMRLDLKLCGSVSEDRLVDGSLWETITAYDSTKALTNISCFQDFLCIEGREFGLTSVWIVHPPTGPSGNAEWHKLTFSEQCYSVHVSHNHVFNTSTVRLGYSSLVTPKQTIHFDVESRTQHLIHQQEVPAVNKWGEVGQYDPSLYACERLEATAQDGKKIPISLVYRKSVDRSNIDVSSVFSSAAVSQSQKPLVLYGYGSYGYAVEPSFDYKRIALLDEGAVFAIGHIRGGNDLGMGWYEDEGKYLTKMNTFTDFCDCAQHLVESGWTSSNQLAIVGRSAGGLLVGAASNMRPDLFKAVVADVPFVDVLTTMSDPSIPLTITEWEEWGNPNEEKFFEYMQSYSPVDNVQSQNYPAMLITAGLNDPRVPYWEPLKWIAKLRQLKTDKNMLLLRTDMSSGHFSASDRYKFLREVAQEYAFILHQIQPSSACFSAPVGGDSSAPAE